LIRDAIEALPQSPDRIRLQVAFEELLSGLAKKSRHPALEWIKTLGAIAIALGALWTLYHGIAEYVQASREQRKAPLFAALADITDPTSAAKRAAGFATLANYVERPDFSRPRPGEVLSDAERVGLVLAFQLIEERSLALRALFVEAMSIDSATVGIALPFLVVSNIGMYEELNQLPVQVDKLAMERKLRASAWAIGRLLHELWEGQRPEEVLNVSEWIGRRPLALFLDEADLTGLDLGTANLRGANFGGSHVENTDLSRAELDDVALQSLCRAKGRDGVRLNPGARARLDELCSREDAR
jgi:hypothetical protein